MLHREGGSRSRLGFYLRCLAIGWAGLLVPGPVPADPAASAPTAPASIVTAGDRLYLTRLGEAMVLSRATAGKIWPGWGLEKTPILIYEPGRVAYLVNHPNPPPGFLRLETKMPLLGTVYAKTGRDLRFNANTSIELAEIPTACIGFSTSPAEAESPSLRFIALVFHEAFHAFQARVGKPEKGAVESLLLRYPDMNPENLALAQLEQMVLFQMVRFDDVPDPERVREFLAIRSARLKSIGEEFLHGERGIEYQEGIPTYIEVRLLDEARKAATGLGGLGSADPYSFAFSVSPELRVSEYVSRLLRFSSDAGTIRARAYATGMALALVLDRMGIDWKGPVMTSDKYLDEILAENAPRTPAESAADLARVMKEFDYGDLLKLVQEKTARLKLQRQQAAETFLNQDGVQILVKLPDSPVEVRGFDPLNVQIIDSNRAIHKRMLRLAFGESAFSASDVPVMVGLGNGPFDIHTLTIFVPADELEMEADYVPVPLEPGEHPFSTSLRLGGGGISLRASAGILTVSPDRHRVEVTLKR